MSLEEIERKLRSVIQAKTISKLKSSAGKDRIEAIVSFKEQVKALPQLDKSAEILIGFLSAVPGWTETNVQVQQQVIDVITYIASKASKLPEICVVLCLQGIVERVADIKTHAQARKCLTTFCEAVGPGFVFERLYAIMKEHKNPKVLSEGILWMVTAVYAFGISSLRLKDLIDFCKEIGLKSSVAAIRNATIKLVETLHNFGVLTYILEECLSDNRILMRQYTLSTLDSWIVAVHLEEMVPYISTALTDDSKMGADWRKDLFYWLFRQPAAFAAFPMKVKFNFNNIQDEFSHTKKNKNVLLPFIRNQYEFECCFAVATAEALGALCVVEGLQPFHIELSVQEIFDNSQKLPENSHQIFEDLPYRNSNRGAGKYIQDFGICEALDYPYRGPKAKKPRCTDRLSKYKCQKFWQLKTATDENEILEEIRRCPIAGLVWGDEKLKKLGADEIYDPDPTQATKVRGHAVLITGYATIGGIPCYEVKNSWGIGWGAQGYGMIARRVMPKVVAFKSAYIEPGARTTNIGLVARRRMIRL